MNQPAISVVIPAHNNAPTLKVAVSSALQQSWAPLQVIVVDDGSTDSSREIASDFGQSVICISQPCKGPSAARNSGVLAANGDFIAYLDADDFWHPDFLKRCSEFLISHPECIAVSTGLCFIQPDGVRTYGPGCAFNGDKPVGEPRVLESFFDFWAKHDHVRTGSVVMSRRAMLDVGLQNEALIVGQDLEFWALLGTYGKWGFIPEPLWICDSIRSVGTRRQKQNKDKLRMKSSPSISDFESRIFNRLRPEDMEPYRTIRGGVVANLVFSNILLGQDSQAHRMVNANDQDLLRCRTGRRFVTVAKLGPVAWHGFSAALRFRRWLQSW